MKDVVAAFLKSSSDRLKNRFIGVLILYWIVFNWKGLVFLMFSKLEISETLDKISGLRYTNVWSNFLGPIIFSFVSISLLPYLNMIIDMIIKKGEIKRIKILSEKKVNRLLGEVDQAKQEAILSNIRTDYKTKEELNNTIELLNDSNSDLERTIHELKNSTKQQEDVNIEAFKKLENNILLLNSEKSKHESTIEDVVNKNIELKDTIEREVKKNKEYENSINRMKEIFKNNYNPPNPNSFKGHEDLDINISIKQEELFKNELIKRKEFARLTLSYHLNKKKIDYFTVNIKNVNQDFTDYFEILLMKYNIKYIDLFLSPF